MLKEIALFFTFLGPIFSFPVLSSSYGKGLCKLPGYHCVKVSVNQSWASLFPDPKKRMLVKKVNRMNTPLRGGIVIAVPNNLDEVNLLDLAPFPKKISPSSINFVKVDLSQLAWAAYDTQGDLINWGPISGGKDYCVDIKRGCRTITGTFTFYSKKGPDCISSRFPLPSGGAPMPHCMHFHGGFAMHGSALVPGYNDSHGCVRLFSEDAKWLNLEFVRVGSTKVRVVP